MEDFGVLVLVVNLIVAMVAATVLVVSFPPRVKAFLRAKRRVFDCWIGLLVVVIVAFLPTSLLVYFVHGQLIPWPLATEAAEVLATGGAESGRLQGDVQALREQHEEWFLQRGGTPEDARQIQLLLWQSWPFIVIGGLLLTFVEIWFLEKFYSKLASDLARQSAPPDWERVIDQLFAESAHPGRRM